MQFIFNFEFLQEKIHKQFVTKFQLFIPLMEDAHILSELKNVGIFENGWK